MTIKRLEGIQNSNKYIVITHNYISFIILTEYPKFNSRFNGFHQKHFQIFSLHNTILVYLKY